MTRVTFSIAATLLLILASAALAEETGKSLVNVDKNGLAIKGYDPVAYFTDNKPLKGDSRFSSIHKGATYRFASQDHKDLFDAKPEKYVPQFGGYCGYAASINKLADIGPEYFSIIDGRLILQHNTKAVKLWNKDIPGNLKRADINWPALVKRHGK